MCHIRDNGNIDLKATYSKITVNIYDPESFPRIKKFIEAAFSSRYKW